jgi:hypothetical protein
MMADMENLCRAEDELTHLMLKMQQRNSELEGPEVPQQQPEESSDVMEVSRLKEQVGPLILLRQLHHEKFEIGQKSVIKLATRQHKLTFFSMTRFSRSD